MKIQTIRKIVGIMMLGVVLGACSSDNNPEPQNNKVNTAPVLKQSTVMGEIYTSEDGLSLYTFNNDMPGQSNCNGNCAVNWPPLMAADDAVEGESFSIITRDNGSKQWALNGWPLYNWINDNAAGDTTGEEVNKLWYVAHTVPVSKWSADINTNGVTNTETVLTDTGRMTLYIFTNDKDVDNGSACNGGCAAAWPPLLAADDAVDNGDFTLVTRDDNSKQWAYLGMPLYRWASDTSPGDTTGEDVNKIWYVAQPLPVSKFNTSEQGIVLSDTSWKTLYVLDTETTANQICAGACLTAWPPLTANEGDVDRGNYTVFTNTDGELQWAYKDQPLYYWNGDAAPDDVNGHGLSHPSGATWVVAKP